MLVNGLNEEVAFLIENFTSRHCCQGLEKCCFTAYYFSSDLHLRKPKQMEVTIV